MRTFKKKDLKDLNELVGGDMFSDGNDRNVTNNSEIETGPVQKPYNDKSDYKKGISTTTNSRYSQNIPQFAVYSVGGRVRENNTIITKKNVEEKIEDLVKRSKPKDEFKKDYNPKVEKVLDEISDLELSENQIEELLKALEDKKNNPSKTNKL